MHSITFKGKTLSTKRDIERALRFQCRCPEDAKILGIKLAAVMEVDARMRYEKETDPYIKNQMKYFLDLGYYDFDNLFGKE